MGSAYCNSCDREVGVKVERPKGKIWLGIVGAVVSFVWLVLQVQTGYSGAGMSVQGSAPSDAYLIIPAGFLIFAIYAAVKLAVRKCAICGSHLAEEKENA